MDNDNWCWRCLLVKQHGDAIVILFGVLEMDNDSLSKVIGVGVVCLQNNMEMQLLLKGVKHAIVCSIIVVMIITLILESGNSIKVTS
jgi:hypothetical protein